jgi:hypothetical protein
VTRLQSSDRHSTASGEWGVCINIYNNINITVRIFPKHTILYIFCP